MSTGHRILGSLSLTAVLVLAGGAGVASAGSSPGYAPVTGLSKVTASQQTLPLISIGTGKNPDLLVDKAGTAHVVFTEDGGLSTPDTLAVCNLQRGQKACAQNSTAPTPQAPPGGSDNGFEGNAPGLNHDYDGAIPLDVENQLYVIQRRFPETFNTPDGGTNDSNVFEWQSTDGGNTLTGPGIIGDNQIAGGAILYGDPGAPSIGTISRTQTEGTFFQGTAPGGYAGDAKAQLGDGSQAFDGSVAEDVSGSIIKPVAAYADTAGDTFIREWTGQGDINDVSTWTAPTEVKGYQPQIIGGPSGVYLLTSSSDINGGVEHLQKVVGTQLTGAITTLATSASPPAISEDATGAISYAFTDQTGIEVQTSLNGSTWNPTQLVTAIPSGEGVGHLVTDATSDGGGFVSFVKNGTGAEDIGTIMVGAFGTQAATGQAGLGPLPGGGIGSAAGDQLATSSCSSAKFGDVDAEVSPRYSACFVPDPADRNMSVTLGTVDLNGLLLIPDPGTRIGIDPKLHKIQTFGSIRIVLRANGIPDITLYHGTLSYDVPDDGDNSDLFSPYFDGAGVKVAGFPVEGNIDVKLAKGGVNIPISLGLPDYLGGYTGSVTLHAASFSGLSIQSLHFSIPDLDLGALEINQLNVGYDSDGDVWTGGANILIPSGGSAFQMKLSVEFDNGQWTKGHLDVGAPYPGIPIDEDPVSLYFTHGYVDLNFKGGTTLTGGVGFGAIPVPLDEDPGPQDFLFSIDASLTASFHTPVTLTMNGVVYLSKVKIGQETLKWVMPDNISFDGNVDINIDPVEITGDIGAQIEPSKHEYGAHLTAQGKAFGHTLVSVGVAINQKGFGARYGIGFVCYWDSGCHVVALGDVTSRFINTDLVRRPHDTTSSSFTVPRGADSASLQVSAAAGAPQVVLVSPGGQQITPTAIGANDPIPTAGTAFELPDPADNETVVVLRTPDAGNWQVMQAPGSMTPVTAVSVGIGQKPPTTKGSVSGTAYTRVFHYHLSRPGTVTFAEQTGKLWHVIGTAKGTSGSIPFTPAIGPAGKRNIVAQLTSGGAAVSQDTVATFTAPGPRKPGRASQLRVLASKKLFSYSFNPPAHATKVLVKLVTTDGRHIQHLFSTKTRHGTLPARGLSDGITVSILGIGPTGLRSAAVSAKASRKVGFPKSKRPPAPKKTKK